MKSSAQSKRSMQLKYPEFAAAAATVTDKFWEDKLNLAAKGKFGARIVDYSAGYLSIKGRRDQFVKVDKTNPHDVADTFITFMRANLSLLSDKDIECMRMPEDSGKKVRERLKTRVLRYVSEYPEVLTQHQKVSLAKTLSFGIDIGVITSASLKLRDGSIASIDGIEYNDDDGEFFLNNRILSNSRCTASLTVEDNLIDIYNPRCASDKKLRKMDLSYSREIARMRK